MEEMVAAPSSPSGSDTWCKKTFLTFLQSSSLRGIHAAVCTGSAKGVTWPYWARPMAPAHPLLRWPGWGRRKSPRAGRNGSFVAAQPMQEQGQGAEEGQTGTIFHMWERVLWCVPRLTLGEVVFLPNRQSLTLLHRAPAQLGWWDRGPPPAARHAPAQSCPHPVPCGSDGLTPRVPGGCVYSRSGNSHAAFLVVPGGNPCPLQRRLLFQQDPAPSTTKLTASPLMSEPSAHAGVSPQPSAGLHEDGGTCGVRPVRCVEHIGAQLRCSFPARAGPEHCSEGATALVGLGPIATVPQHQAVVAECWGVTGGDWWHSGQAVSRHVSMGDVRTQPCAHHTSGIAGWGCWGTLVSPPRCSPAPCLRFSTRPAVPAPSCVPTTSVGQGGVTELGPRPGGASPVHSGDAGFCMGDPLCSDLLPVCPSCPTSGAGWGPTGVSARGRPLQRAGSRAAAGRRPPRQLQAGIELLCLEPVRH